MANVNPPPAARSWRRRVVEERTAPRAAWPREGRSEDTWPPSTVKCSSVLSCGTAYRTAGGARGAPTLGQRIAVQRIVTTIPLSPPRPPPRAPGLASSAADRPPGCILAAPPKLQKRWGRPRRLPNGAARDTHLRGMSHSPSKGRRSRTVPACSSGPAATATSGAARDAPDKPIGVPPLTAAALIGSATDDGGRFSVVWAAGAWALPRGVGLHRRGRPPPGRDFGWGFGWRDWPAGMRFSSWPPPTSRNGPRVLHQRVVRGRQGAEGGCAACWRERHPHS